MLGREKTNTFQVRKVSQCTNEVVSETIAMANIYLLRPPAARKDAPCYRLESTEGWAHGTRRTPFSEISRSNGTGIGTGVIGSLEFFTVWVLRKVYNSSCLPMSCTAHNKVKLAIDNLSIEKDYTNNSQKPCFYHSSTHQSN